MLRLSPAAIEQLQADAWREAQRRLGKRGDQHREPWARKHRAWLWPDVRLDLDQHAYLVGIYQDEHPDIVVQKAAQLGLSEWAITEAFWAADECKANILYLLPTGRDVGDFSTARIVPAIEASPHIASLVGGGESGSGYRARSRERTTIKRVGDRFIYFRHGHVKRDSRASQLKIMSIDVLIVDELDEMDPRVLPIAMMRLEHSALRWVRRISTPSFPGAGIDGEMQRTDKRRWFVTCDGCGHEQALDVMSNLILETDAAGRPSRWRHKRGDPRAPFVACVKCDAPLDVRKGTWQPTADGRAHGYIVPKIASPLVDLMGLIDRGRELDPTKRKEWYNQDLGLPWVTTGSSYGESEMHSTLRPYGWPLTSNGTAMGVDVGSQIHVVVRRWRRREGVMPARRAVWVGTVRDFEDLDPLMTRFGVRQVVVDALPETRKAKEFANRWPGRVRMAWYVDQLKGEGDVREKQSDPLALDLDRTRTLDGLWAAYRGGEIENSALLAHDEEWKRHFRAVSRVIEKTAKGGSVARWVASAADHYVHADNYCNVALDLMGLPPQGETSVVVGAEQEGAENRRNPRASSWREGS